MNIEEIINISDDTEFINQLADYILNKTDNNEGLSKGERFIDLYIRFLAAKDMDGFGDLFYQEYSLKECEDIIYWFNELGLVEASKKFNRALEIYCNGKKDISDEEFKELDPFALEESQGKEFDTIGKFFEDEICGLYGCEDVIRKWIIDNRNLF